MSTYTIIILALIGSAAMIYLVFTLLKTRFFNKHFDIYIQESYNLDDLFPIKLNGKIIPKADFLDVPYEELQIQVDTKTIRGTISNNIISIELIRPMDRKKAVFLIKAYYTKTVRPYIKEAVKNKKEYIVLRNLSKKQQPNLKKIACNTCKHRVQCQITFTECHYEREDRDKILDRGIVVNSKKNYELDTWKK
ncbi:hypothetical protein [Alkaliphilus oremlandii]|uniref:Uncharacterized protein n=1 Tax=Alkaliphilus oremlandii (strain OhILAs) TaxID=350688 RepID=A8MIH3_ALKOO|nr:hypothetical protein [Alkaliphilus oremlandii]ABW19605.1 hypothetical protein Clos_2069 [Alkaliphilus oremlandii OhILAs]